MRDRAAAEIEAEKTAAIADVRAEVADLALAGRRQGRRGDHERRPPAPARRGVPGDRGLRRDRQLMRPVSADGTPRHGRPPLRRGRVRGRPARRHGRDVARRAGRRRRDRSRRTQVGRDARQPGRRRSRPGPRWREAMLGRSSSRPVLNLVGLLLRRGRIDLLPRVAAEFRRLDDADRASSSPQPPAPRRSSPDEVRALTARLEQMSGGRVELDPRWTQHPGRPRSCGSATA